MKLILIRHAKSSWADDSLDDHARPLNARGRRDAPRMGQWLSENGHLPHEVLCSDAVRTKETLALMRPYWPDAAVSYCPTLYHASPTEITDVLKTKACADCVAVVGHNPGMGELAAELVGTAPDHPRFADFPTCSVAVLAFGDQGLVRGAAELCAFATPHDLTQ